MARRLSLLLVFLLSLVLLLPRMVCAQPTDVAMPTSPSQSVIPFYLSSIRLQSPENKALRQFVDELNKQSSMQFGVRYDESSVSVNRIVAGERAVLSGLPWLEGAYPGLLSTKPYLRHSDFLSVWASRAAVSNWGISPVHKS